MKPTKEQQNAVALDRLATKFELDAAVAAFEGACYRDDNRARMVASDKAHAAFEAHMQAIASSIDLAKRSVGL